jgi:hypothetical protein
MAPADDAREPRGISCAGARAPAGLVATRAESPGFDVGGGDDRRTGCESPALTTVDFWTGFRLASVRGTGNSFHRLCAFFLAHLFARLFQLVVTRVVASPAGHSCCNAVKLSFLADFGGENESSKPHTDNTNWLQE